MGIMIKLIRKSQMRTIINCYAPIGRYVMREGSHWVACDNTTGDAWTEAFDDARQAVKWLCMA